MAESRHIKQGNEQSPNQVGRSAARDTEDAVTGNRLRGQGEGRADRDASAETPGNNRGELKRGSCPAKADGGDDAAAMSRTDKDESAQSPSERAESADDQPNLHNKRLGRLGEDVAARYLVSRGYEIIARNWTCQAGEADIIARDDDILVFAEVKTRSSTEKGFPSEAVDSKKRGKYLKIAELFASRYDVEDLQVRFDVMSLVVTDNAHATIRHYINAFGAESL